MNPFSLICLGLAGMTHFVLGSRLLWLSRSTRGVPELLWGLTWLLAAIENFSDALSGVMPTPELKLTLRWVVAISFPLVVMAIFIANWRLFRPNAPWAKVVSILVSMTMVIIFVHQVAGPGIDVEFAGTTRSLLNWVDNVAINAGLIWAAAEAWRHYRMFDKRWRLGLASRMLGLRYFMWFGSAAAMVFFWGILWLNQAIGLPVWLFDISLPLVSLVSVILMWITFFPPEALVARLDQEAPAP